jgi:hypothetical protein
MSTCVEQTIEWLRIPRHLNPVNEIISLLHSEQSSGFEADEVV